MGKKNVLYIACIINFLWLIGCYEGVLTTNSSPERPFERLTEPGPTYTYGILRINTISSNIEDAALYQAGSDRMIGSVKIDKINQSSQIESITFNDLFRKAEIGEVSLWNHGKKICSDKVIDDGTVTCKLPSEISQTADSIYLTLTARVLGPVGSVFQFSIDNPASIQAREHVTDRPVKITTDNDFPLLLTKGQVVATSLEATVDMLSPSGTQKAGKKIVGAIFDLIPYGENAVLTGFDVKFSLGSTLSPSMITNLELFDDQGNQIGMTKSTIGTGNPVVVYTGIVYNLPKTVGKRILVKFDFANTDPDFAPDTITVSLQNIQAVGEQFGTAFSIPKMDSSTVTMTP